MTLRDSSVICAWLERVHPQPALYPAETAITRGSLVRGICRRHDLPRGRARPFFQKIIRPNILKEETDALVVGSILDDAVPRVFGYLESEIAGDHLAGGRFGIADINRVEPDKLPLSRPPYRWAVIPEPLRLFLSGNWIGHRSGQPSPQSRRLRPPWGWIPASPPPAPPLRYSRQRHDPLPSPLWGGARGGGPRRARRRHHQLRFAGEFLSRELPSTAGEFAGGFGTNARRRARIRLRHADILS